MKAWLRRWLGAVSIEDYPGNRAGIMASVREEHATAIAELKRSHNAEIAALKDEHATAIADVITELNTLSGKIPVHVTQDDPKPSVRVLRNFREFRTTIEHKPLRHERTS
jgi:alkyl hydroperoxide reductase subunit AhpF